MSTDNSLPPIAIFFIILGAIIIPTLILSLARVYLRYRITAEAHKTWMLHYNNRFDRLVQWDPEAQAYPPAYYEPLPPYSPRPPAYTRDPLPIVPRSPVLPTPLTPATPIIIMKPSIVLPFSEPVDSNSPPSSPPTPVLASPARLAYD
ncbi:hypothetical protein D9758_001809 [Tetrapyrgos nigripes]|uniref:Uncharacterized protein n=1 Tax=Tetrapyrgos nigripes TaxID=182062 RepID=A0A8H5GTM4_9AGAR|nr:hypothetical protein D9758_001809 [Tetrapyrgos nigripes]